MAKALSNSLPQSYRIHLLGEVSGAVVYSRAIFCVLVAAALTMLCGIADTASAQTCYLPANVADATAGQMKPCFKLILEKDPGKTNIVHENAPCENFYQALLDEAQYTRAPNQVRKDAFCEQVAEWHPQGWFFAGYPYWKDCAEAAVEKPRFDNLASREQVKRLTSCLKGYTDYQKKHADRLQYDNCSATFDAFEKAWQNGIIEHSKSLSVYRLNCVHYGYAVRQFVFPNPDWTYCTGYPASDTEAQDRHFYYCMQSSLPKLNDCTDALRSYEVNLRAANMGTLPKGYAPPSCQRIEGFIAAAQPVEATPDQSEIATIIEPAPEITTRGDGIGLITFLVGVLFAGAFLALLTEKYSAYSRKMFLVVGLISSTLSTAKLIADGIDIGFVGVQEQIMNAYLHLTAIAQKYVVEIPFKIYPPEWARHVVAIWLFFGAANGRFVRAVQRQENKDYEEGFEYPSEYQDAFPRFLKGGRLKPLSERMFTMIYVIGTLLGPIPLIVAILSIMLGNWWGFPILLGSGFFLVLNALLTAAFLFKNYQNIMDMGSG